MRALLTQLQPSFPFLGDVRGVGMMMGVEIIRCPRTKAHAPVLAKWIKERMKVQGFCLHRRETGRLQCLALTGQRATGDRS